MDDGPADFMGGTDEQVKLTQRFTQALQNARARLGAASASPPPTPANQTTDTNETAKDAAAVPAAAVGSLGGMAGSGVP